MSTIDDILKKSLSGTTVKSPVRTGDVESAFAASKNGIEADIFNFHSLVPPVAPVAPKKKSFLNRALTGLLGDPGTPVADRPGYKEKYGTPNPGFITDAIADTNYFKLAGVGLNEMEQETGQDSAAEKVLKKASSLVGGSSADDLPFGVGDVIRGYKDVYHNPQSYAEFTLEDVLGGIVQASKEFEKTPIRAYSNFIGVPFKFNVPVLGEVSNRQFNAAQRINNGEDPLTVTAEEGVGSVFDTLFILGMAQEMFGPRATTTNKFEVSREDFANSIKNPPAPMQSFRLYNEVGAMQPVSPATVQKMISEGKLDPGAKFNPELPTYFKGYFKPNGNFVGEVVQIKPSLFNTLKNSFRTKEDPVYQSTLKSLESSGHDLDRAIESGDMPVNKIYASKDGVLQPAYANHVVDDIAGKLDAYQPGLGAEFKNSVDLTHATPTNLEIQGKNFLNQSLSTTAQPIPPVLPPAYNTSANTTPIITKELPLDIAKGQEAKIEQLLPAIKENPDEHLVSTARVIAENTGNQAIIDKVNEAIAIGKESLNKTQQVEDNLASISEQSVQTPEKQLSEPSFEPYRPTVVRQPYNTTPMAKFVSGTFEGKPYTSDGFIMEFNSTAKAPAKATLKTDGPTEESLRKMIIPKLEEAEPVKITKVQSSDVGDFVQLEGDNVKLDINRRYFDYFNRKYPNTVFMAVAPDKPVVVMSGGKMMGLVMPMNLQSAGLKLSTTWQKPAPAQPKLKNPPTVSKTKTKVTKKAPVLEDGELGSMRSEPKAIDSLTKKEMEEVIDYVRLKKPFDQKIEEMAGKLAEKYGIENKTLAGVANKLQDLIEGTKTIRVASGELGSFASPHGNKTIRKIIERQNEVQKGEVQEPPKDFKLSARAKAILDEFGVKVGEKSLSGRLLGVYKPLTDKVRVQALYDITTVTHEAIHAIDHQLGFSKDLIAGTGRGDGIRNRLTDIYEELYPKAKRTHTLEKRMHEGLAVFFENYFYDPASITAKYPDLVDAFIKPEGTYYTPEFTKLLERMNELVDDYSRLSPEEKIGARIRTGKEVVDRQTGFTWKQRIEYELFNRFEPLKRYARDVGATGTWDDPLVQAFNILNKNTIITNWVKGENTPILMRDGNFRIEKGSVADYLKMIKGDEKAFRSYLVARRVVAENNKLNELKNLDENLRTAFEDEINKLENIIKNDDFSLQDASAVVDKYATKFQEAETLYDEINKRLIDFSEENGLIDAETADLYRSEKGYASFRRYIDEELASVGTISTSSKSKVTSFKERTGSQLDIIDPIYNQITSINEIVGKGLENRLWERVANLANKNPEVSQRFEKITAKPALDAEGRVSFPQEKDPNIVRVFKGGKREFYKVAPEFAAITKQLRGKEQDAFVQFLRIPSSLFTRLTTSANPIFAVGNLTVDQFSALAQTKTGFKPIVDPIKSFKAYVTSDVGIQAYIAMGGKRQTLAAFYDLAPEDVAHKLTGGETKMEKVQGVVDSALGILELPSNTSEIMTRFSEFKRAKDMGKTDSEAMYMASEVTTPFQLQGNIGGRFGQEIIKAIPYFNAAIQVMYKFGRSTKDDPKRMGSVIAGLLTIGLTAAIAMYKGASEKQKRLLAEQPVRNLSNYLYFPSPDGENLIKIKIPQQMGVFSGMAYLFAADHYGKNKATFDDYVDVVSSSIPEQVQFYKPKNMLLSWLPQVIKPSVEVASNTKTFPDIGPIVPPYMVDKAPKEQYNAYTSEVAKTIGGLIGASPTLTEFWIRNQFGVVGGLTIGKLPGNPVWIQEKDYVMTGRSYNRFYENRTLVQQQYDEVITNDKVTQKYSQEEKYAVKAEHAMYDNVSDLLTEMREINKSADLPENIKSAAYDVLLNIDSTENIRDIEPQVRALQSEIQAFKSGQRK